MVYTVTMTSPAHRMFRRLSPKVRRQLIREAKKLSDNPRQGKQLKGQLRAFRSLHTVYEGMHYRIIYEVKTRLREIIVRAAGSRENLYKKLSRMKLHPLGD